MSERCVVETCVNDAVRRVRTSAPPTGKYKGFLDASLSLPVCEMHGSVAYALDSLREDYELAKSEANSMREWHKENGWPERPQYPWGYVTPATDEERDIRGT